MTDSSIPKTISWITRELEAKYYTCCSGKTNEDILEIIDRENRKNKIVLNKDSIEFLEKVIKEIKLC